MICHSEGTQKVAAWVEANSPLGRWEGASRAEYVVVKDGKDLEKIDTSIALPSYFLGVLGKSSSLAPVHATCRVQLPPLCSTPPAIAPTSCQLTCFPLLSFALPSCLRLFHPSYFSGLAWWRPSAHGAPLAAQGSSSPALSFG